MQSSKGDKKQREPAQSTDGNPDEMELQESSFEVMNA